MILKLEFWAIFRNKLYLATCKCFVVFNAVLCIIRTVKVVFAAYNVCRMIFPHDFKGRILGGTQNIYHDPRA